MKSVALEGSLSYGVISSKNGVVAGLLDVGGSTCNQPQRIIVETASDIRVALFGERLVLMVSTSVLKLCGGDIEDTLSCAIRDQMNETEQILTGITESHAASDAGFIIGSGTAHVEGNHTLILVPDVYHAVKLLLGGRNGEVGEQFVPVIF